MTREAASHHSDKTFIVLAFSWQAQAPQADWQNSLIKVVIQLGLHPKPTITHNFGL
jgi:hypothetical protein